MDEGQRSRGFRILLEVWSRRKWLAILVFAAVFPAAATIVTVLPNVYRSSTTVLIERQQVPEAFVRPTVTSAVESRLQTITQEILSRSRLLSLIDRFGLYQDLKKRVPLEEVVEQMRRDIELELKGIQQRLSGGTTIAFAVSFKGSDPQKVALVTNTLASFYIEENLKVRERQAAGTAEFLQVQLEEAKKKLDDQERLVSEFKTRYIGELPQQQEANLLTWERLNTQLRLNNENQARAIERRTALSKLLGEGDTFEPAGGPDATVARIAKLKQELTELKTRFNDKYPDVLQVKAQIAALEERLTSAKSDRGRGDEGTAAASPARLQPPVAIRELDAEIKVLKAEDQNLRRLIAAYQRRVENAPRREQEFQLLSRDYQSTKELYHSLLKRYEEARLAESMEQRQKGEQFRVLDSATASERPAAPNRGRLILLGFFLSLGLAAGTAVLAEQLDTSFHAVDDLRAFSKVPVLASIPRIVTAGDILRRRWRVRLTGVSAIVALALIVATAYFLARGNERWVSMLAGGRS